VREREKEKERKREREREKRKRRERERERERERDFVDRCGSHKLYQYLNISFIVMIIILVELKF
jgi:hypothetical protein